MATYKFPQFSVEITDPTVTVLTVTDSIQVKECDVNVLLAVPNANFGVTFTGFTYVSDWNDIEIEAWVLVELQQYEV